MKSLFYAALAVFVMCDSAYAGKDCGADDGSAYAWDFKTGKTLCSSNADEKVPVASLTKLFSFLSIKNKSGTIKIDTSDVDRLKNSKSVVKPGTIIEKSQAIHLSLMSSENRIASALARSDEGGLKGHLSRMNSFSKSATFVEPTGLSPENQATSRDVAKAFAMALSKKDGLAALSSKELDVKWGKRHTWHHTFEGVRKPWKGIIAAKTGYTNEAGRCIALAFEGKKRVGLVILGTTSKKDRDAEIRRILRSLGEDV